MAKGFTLVELLVVITVLVILAGLGLGTASYVTAKARESGTEARVDVVGRRALRQLQEKGACPASMADLEALVKQPSWMENGVIVDLWGRPLEYVVNGRSFRVRSAGSDGALGTADDIEFAR